MNKLLYKREANMSLVDLLKGIPAAAWSALAAAIVTSTIAFFGVFLTNKGNHKRMLAQHRHERLLRKDQILIERAEELYVILKKLCNAMVADHFPYISAIKGDFSYQTALEMSLENSKNNNYDPSRMEMIAEIYFPQISQPIHDLVEFNSKIIEIRFIFKQRGKKNDEELLDLYAKKMSELNSAIKNLEKLVIETIKNV